MAVIRVQAKGLFKGNDVGMVTPAFRRAEAIGAGDVADVLADFVDRWTTLIGFLTVQQPQDWLWTTIRLLQINETTGVETFIAEEALNIFGQIVGVTGSLFECPLVSIFTLGNPRSAKLFLPCFIESAFLDNETSGLLNAALVSFTNTIVQSYVGDVTGTTWFPGMWSKLLTAFFDSSGSGSFSMAVTHQVKRKVGRGD